MILSCFCRNPVGLGKILSFLCNHSASLNTLSINLKINHMKGVIILFALISFIACKQAPKVSEWRGADRTGVYSDTNLLTSWPIDGPAVVWETDSIGNGYSSPVMTDEFVFVTGETDSLGYLY